MKYARVKYGEVFDFVPRSWIFTNYSKDLILQYERERSNKLLQSGTSKNALWIGKPSCSSRGRGIILTSNLEDFVEELPRRAYKQPSRFGKALDTEEKNENETPVSTDKQVESQTSPTDSVPVEDLIVIQEYISNPYLINGYKFDLRIYVLVTNFTPLVAYIYEQGLVRFCTKPYSLEDLDLLKHLTNSSIQQKVAKNNQITEEEEEKFIQQITSALGPGDFSKRTLADLRSYFERNGMDFEGLWKKITKTITLSLLSMAYTVDSPSPQAFELFGFDILLTSDLEPKLIEVNLAPSLACSGVTDFSIKLPLLDDTLTLIFDKNDSSEGWSPDSQPSTPPSNRWQLIFPFNSVTQAASNELKVGHDTVPFKVILEEMQKCCQE
eukprot:TRINITY_DN3353_c0_g1_i6.p1 TRINITY_DN3353_c0_g1~~TRINITY_DN3353_c0_g1_i6.p1  ORF type:complete len:382 (+),score=72.45 TRINITY_DN3353_c0_g1_i6:295-1440(+)